MSGVSRHPVRPFCQVDLAYCRTPCDLCCRGAYHPSLGTTGPLFGFSNTWQLAINTGTTIITFLMVFLIQNTQSRDGTAVQLKLDELIRAIDGAHNGLLDLEELSDEDLARVKANFEALARASREDLKRGLRDTGTTELPPD